MNISKLQQLIDGQSVTKAKILKTTGLTRPTLDGILSGKDFRVSTLEKIAKAVGVNVGVFFDEEEVKINQAGRDFFLENTFHDVNPVYAAATNKRQCSPAGDDTLSSEIASLKETIEQLRSQLKDKERIIQLYESRK